MIFRHEEINGGNTCPTYMHRWTLLRLFGRAVYLHKFVGDDWTLDLHDHPKRFVSIGLWGRYLEETPVGPPFWREGDRLKTLFRAPWIRTFPAAHQHRITLAGKRKSCWTLVLLGKSSREWGFWHEGKFIQWRDYVSDPVLAASMKSCD